MIFVVFSATFLLSPPMLQLYPTSQQVPWIMSGSVRSNILFGQPFDKARYTSAIDASALTVDLAALPAGDETELGERGINLSGGQKARVALARALYSQRSVVLLDDPLSAVDPRVGATIFQRALGSQVR